MTITTDAPRDIAERPLAPAARPRRRTPDLRGIGAPARASIDAGRIPFAIVGVSDAWSTLHLQALAGPDEVPSTASVIYLASITKPVTAIAVMQLVDESRLDLDAPIARVIPELRGSGRERITMRHLLTHTSGLADGDHMRLAKERPGWDRQLAMVLAQTPEWEPGTRYRYATDPFMLVGETIARLTGMPYADAVRKRILEPLGMRDTTFDPRPFRGRVMPVVGLPMKNPITREVLFRFSARSTMPGCGLFSTADDLLRLGRALLPRRGQDSPRILSQARIDEMLTEQTIGIPMIREDGTRVEPHYALGWGKRHGGGSAGGSGTDDDDGPIPASPLAAGHGGASGTRIHIDPARDLVTVFLSGTWYGDEAAQWGMIRRVYAAWDEEEARAV
jgi:hypothetical protein